MLDDAQAFLWFVDDWAAVHKSSVKGFPRPVLNRCLIPKMLTGMAAGDIIAKETDEEVLKTARTLPIHRYDWWASDPGCPEVFQSRTRPSPELMTAKFPPLGKRIRRSPRMIGIQASGRRILSCTTLPTKSRRCTMLLRHDTKGLSSLGSMP